MNKKVTLSLEESKVLRSLANDQLRVLTEFKDAKEFHVLEVLVNILIDVDKNVVFSENEAAITPTELALKHAYARGAAGRGTTLLRLIVGSASEILRREEAMRKAKASRVM